MDITELKHRLNTVIWETRLRDLPELQRLLIKTARIFLAVSRDISSGLPTLRAMSLVYTTLLSLVPLIAVSFSVLKGFGVHNQIEPVLLAMLEPLGDHGVEITDKIIDFVDNVNVKVLGSLSLLILVYTVVTLLTKIEQALNYTWHIRKFRSFVQRVSEYVSVVMIGPLLIFTAIGLTASISNSSVANYLASMESLGTIIWIAGKVTSFILLIGAITFIYLLVPNTRVKFTSALLGAFVASLLWKLTGWLFGSFVSGSTNYSAIYSGFAVLIVFIIWLYLSWLILLIGTSVAYYYQNPEKTSPRHQVRSLSSRMLEKTGLLIMLRVAQSFHYDTDKWTLRKLALKLDVSSDALRYVLEVLQQKNLLVLENDRQGSLLPGKSLEHISAMDILIAVRRTQENPYLNPEAIPSDASVDEVMQAISDSVENALKGISLLTLVEKSGRPATSETDSRP